MVAAVLVSRPQKVWAPCLASSISDEICIHADEHGEIIEVRGEQGGPPYVVRFPGGQQRTIFPGRMRTLSRGSGSGSGSGSSPVNREAPAASRRSASEGPSRLR
jgi:hypothetical protein